MIIRMAAALIASAALLAPAFGAEELTAQQQRMKSCNAQATDKHLTGDERQSYMSRCLKGGDEKDLTVQQQKMKACNRQASDKDLKADQRRDFMSECLRADRGERGSPAAGSSRATQR